MQTYVFEGTITALSSITHNGGQSFGINQKLRREKFIGADGQECEVPVISGNAIRGTLRDKAMLHMCRALGYGVPDTDGVPRGLSLAAFHFLFSGGALTSTGSRGIDIDAARQIRHLIPLVGVFGGAMGNQIMPGKLKVGKALPVCREIAHLLPEEFAALPHAQRSIWSYLQEEMYTRKDDEKDEHKRHLLSGETRKQLDDSRRVAALKKSEPVEETGQKQQMRYFVETIAAGTVFHWKLVLDDVTPIEFEAFATALVEFSKTPYLGGKSNVGLGEVAIRFDRWLSIDSRAKIDVSTEVALPAGQGYAAHLRDRGGEMRAMLEAFK
jgi:CRISPR type IV-associated protein Csf2